MQFTLVFLCLITSQIFLKTQKEVYDYISPDIKVAGISIVENDYTDQYIMECGVKINDVEVMSFKNMVTLD